MTFQEFIHNAFSPVNTVLSVLLILSVIYWIFTMLTGLDIDVGIDTDTDIDVDMDAPDGHVHVSHDPSAWAQFLKFLNLDIVPLTYFLTLTLLLTWLGSVYLNAFIPLPVWLAALAVVPLLVISLFLTKVMLKPLVPFFREINHKGEKPHDFLGREGKLKSSIHGEKIGSMEVFIGSDPMTLMVRSKEGKPLDYGMYVMIVDEDPEKRIYYVEQILQL
ncbi:hypothetical protein [Chryseobacterium sp. CT-SW4]|uniref:hypothetical protein n=1 Tax=Chryseobacterium sp. SW-1 TaxID=3157343 RepID=UPI003B0177C0